MITSVRITQRPITARVTSGERQTVVRVRSTSRARAIFVGRQGPRGANGAGFVYVTAEVPSGLLNGSNATFTTEFDFVPESVAVYVNGLIQKRGDDFNTTGLRTILLSVSPANGEHVLVNYLRS